MDDVTARECPNLRRVRLDQVLRQRLTPDLFTAPKITESPLYTPGRSRGDSALVNRTKENLFIHGITWNELLPHLRLVFACLPIKYKIAADGQLRDVFVGNEAYKSKAKSRRDELETYNGLPDFIGKSYDLVVIRLGSLAYKNVAAPGVLREALMIREGEGKPTWLFEDSDPTIRWEHSRDLDVEEYIKKRFIEVTLDGGGPVADLFEEFSVDTSSSVESPDENQGPTEHMQQVPVEDRGAAAFTEEASSSNFDNLMGGGDSKSKYKKKSNWGRR